LGTPRISKQYSAAGSASTPSIQRQSLLAANAVKEVIRDECDEDTKDNIELVQRHKSTRDLAVLISLM